MEDDLGAGQTQRPPSLREVAVVTDVDPDPSHRGIEDRIAGVAGTKVELLPETLDVRDVGFAVLPQVGAVGVDHGGGVVVKALLLDLEHGDHQHHPRVLGELLHPLGRWSIGNRFGIPEVLVLLYLAEVGAVEQLLEAQHLGPVLGGLAGQLDRLGDHRLLVAGPRGLDESRSYDVGHWGDLLRYAGG